MQRMDYNAASPSGMKARVFSEAERLNEPYGVRAVARTRPVRGATFTMRLL